MKTALVIIASLLIPMLALYLTRPRKPRYVACFNCGKEWVNHTGVWKASGNWYCSVACLPSTTRAGQIDMDDAARKAGL